MTADEAVRLATERLARAGVDTPRVDAELIVAHVLGVSRTAVHAEPGRPVPDAFEDLVARRERREPLAYVLGEWGFRRLVLRTDARALVPRPETEIVVERCLELLRGQSEPRVLDVGVGSGAIALAIADEHPGARVTGVDSSAAAIELARENAARLGLKVELRVDGVDAAAEGWDLVVSNPPYVLPHELDALQPEVREWEPRAALLDEGQTEALVTAAARGLEGGGRLVLEVHEARAAEVAGLLAAAGFEDVTIGVDLGGRERIVDGRST